MALNLLFLLSCIATARVLDKRKMKMATVLYIVMIIVITAVLLLTVDVGFVSQILTKAWGDATYKAVHNAFAEAMSTPMYGKYIVGAILLTFVVQIFVTLIFPVKEIVSYILKKDHIYHSFKKNYNKIIEDRFGFNVYKPINLIYCRMLN